MATAAEGVPSRPFPIGGLRRRWKLMVVLGALGLLIGLLLSEVLPARYSSTVSLIIEPSLGNPFAPTDSGQSLDNVTTEVVVAGSTPVAEKVRETVNTELSAKELRDLVQVENLPNSQVLEMTVTSTSPEDARELAGAFATAYLEYRQEVSVGATQNLLTGLEASAADARTTIDVAVRRLARSRPDSETYQLAQSRIRSASATLTELETQADEARFSRAEPGRVLSPATRPPGERDRYLYPAGGLLAGLLLGIAIATRRALRDDRIFAVRDLETVGPPVLSPISSTRQLSSKWNPREARLLSASFRGRLGPDRSAVVITAVGPGVDVVQGALAMVVAMRADALDVALVELSTEAEAEAPEPARLAAAKGETSWVRRRQRKGRASQQHVESQDAIDQDLNTPVYRIRGERLDERQFSELVDRLRARHEVVVIAGQNLADSATLDAVEAIGDTMLVVPMGKYGETAIKSAVDQVRLFHGRVIALVAG